LESAAAWPLFFFERPALAAATSIRIPLVPQMLRCIGIATGSSAGSSGPAQQAICSGYGQIRPKTINPGEPRHGNAIRPD